MVLLSWSGLFGGARVIMLVRARELAAQRAPLPLLRVPLTRQELRQWRAFPDYRSSVPVLGFHGVGSSKSYLTTPRRLFALQMEALKVAGFHTLTIEQYAAYVHGHSKGLPSRPILITFDDGRLDAYRAADAILRHEGFHATELAVPGWVRTNPGFSLSWSQLERMNAGGTWQVQEHFGYGHEAVRIDALGKRGAAFGYREYLPGRGGRSGHLESLAHFKERLVGNLLWGERQLAEHIPGYRPLALAVPEANYGQEGTNDRRIPPYVLSWLDRHFPVVLGGDYLDRGPNRPFAIPGRFSTRFQYRIILGERVTLASLRCRLLDYVLHRPIWKEYSCYGRAGPASLHPYPHGFSSERRNGARSRPEP